MVLQAIKYKRGKLQILDQLRLPHEQIYIDIKFERDAWDAIKSMQVRGAPAIAIVAALSVAVRLANGGEFNSSASGTPCSDFISNTLKFLVTSRPTAVNLADAARKLEKVASAAAAQPNSTVATVSEAYIEAAEQMLVDDVRDNNDIGESGAEWIQKHAVNHTWDGKLSVLTHCNTG